MRKKRFIKFRSKYSKGPLNQIEFEGKLVSLTMGDSQKVKHIREHGSIEIAPNLLSNKYVETKVRIHEEEEYAERVFEYMKCKRHSHYKQFDAKLVAIEYLK